MRKSLNPIEGDFLSALSLPLLLQLHGTVTNIPAGASSSMPRCWDTAISSHRQAMEKKKGIFWDQRIYRKPFGGQSSFCLLAVGDAGLGPGKAQSPASQGVLLGSSGSDRVT